MTSNTKQADKRGSSKPSSKPTGEQPRVYGYRVGKTYYKSYAAAMAGKGSSASVIELHTGNVYGG